MEMLQDFYMILVYLVHNIIQIKNNIQVIQMNQIQKVIKKFVINMGKYNFKLLEKKINIEKFYISVLIQ